jgi:hypothetical protein
VVEAGVTDTESIVRVGVVSFPVGVQVDFASTSCANSCLIVSNVIYLLRSPDDFVSVVIYQAEFTFLWIRDVSLHSTPWYVPSRNSSMDWG